MPTSRFDRELEFREPVLTKTPPVRVGSLWAVKNKRTGEVTGYCASETHARAVAAHGQHFEVEEAVGPFELPDGLPTRPEPIPEGRFHRIVEGD